MKKIPKDLTAAERAMVSPERAAAGFEPISKTVARMLERFGIEDEAALKDARK